MVADLRPTFARWAQELRDTRPPDALDRAAALLRDSGLTDAAVLEHLRLLAAAGDQRLLLESVRASSHVKWSLYAETHDGPRVWLHDYVVWTVGEDRFAASVHDHRYAFASLVLRGGYTEHRWTADGGRLLPTTRAIGTGEVNEVRTGDIHSLAAVRPGTRTLVLQLPAARRYSTVSHPGPEGAHSTHRQYDLVSMLDTLCAPSDQ